MRLFEFCGIYTVKKYTRKIYGSLGKPGNVSTVKVTNESVNDFNGIFGKITV